MSITQILSLSDFQCLWYSVPGGEGSEGRKKSPDWSIIAVSLWIWSFYIMREKSQSLAARLNIISHYDKNMCNFRYAKHLITSLLLFKSQFLQLSEYHRIIGAAISKFAIIMAWNGLIVLTGPNKGRNSVIGSNHTTSKRQYSWQMCEPIMFEAICRTFT